MDNLILDIGLSESPYKEITSKMKRFKGLVDYLDRLIPKMVHPPQEESELDYINTDGLTLAIAIKDYLDTEDTFRLNQVIDG